MRPCFFCGHMTNRTKNGGPSGSLQIQSPDGGTYQVLVYVCEACEKDIKDLALGQTTADPWIPFWRQD